MSEIILKEKFVQFRAAGMSYDRVAKELGKSKQTLVNWGKALELEIKNLRAIEIESLLEQYWLCKQHRIEKIGGLLQRAKIELDSRDFSDVSTEKLIELTLKLHELAAKEQASIVFQEKRELTDFDHDLVSWSA